MNLRRTLIVFVIAPAAAAALITLLLLAGIRPHLVFLPGFAVRSIFESAGIHAHNRVGVIATLLFWWAVILMIAIGVRRHRS